MQISYQFLESDNVAVRILRQVDWRLKRQQREKPVKWCAAKSVAVRCSM